MTAAMTIVGIGASAGGVEALQALFAGMPADSGMAFVVVTHLARGRESALPEIIARTTQLPVSEAQGGIEVRRGLGTCASPDSSACSTRAGVHMRRDRTREIAVGAALLCLGASVALAQVKLSDGDRAFIEQAAEGGHAEGSRSVSPRPRATTLPSARSASG